MTAVRSAVAVSVRLRVDMWGSGLAELDLLREMEHTYAAAGLW